MCGIAGFISTSGYNSENLLEMAKTLSHRGPDDQGFWINPDDGIGLAHTRLSILDLSPAGHQPMESSSGRYVMIYNGEIYNHKDLLKDLESIKPRNLRGHSDTEILLLGIEEWGIKSTLEKIDGMFAIAIWDKKTKSLYLIRDRMGEKPLYYGWINDNFVFSSELKAIKKLPKFCNDIDRNSLALFLRFNSIPAPHSIYKSISKLEPGKILKIDLFSMKTEISSYWSTEEIFEAGRKNMLNVSSEQAISILDDTLKLAISKQMHSDVPLGAFLSGGIDSSTIVALMQSTSHKKVNTFSIGFDIAGYNEAEHAKAVANHIGTNHFDMYVTENDALDVIPNISSIYDEPFADSSQIPTYLVSKIAKQKVSVALSGDAGDELFGGYNRYIFTKKLFSKINMLPITLRKYISKLIFSLSEEKWNRLLSRFLSNHFANIGYKMHKGANVLLVNNIRDLHFKLASHVQNPSSWLLNANEYKTPLNDGIERFNEIDPIDEMMIYDLLTYLPTDILTKVDRAAMAVSLETRVPFLDPDVIKFSASLPLEYKIRDGESKWILRQVLYKYVPKSLIDRPKMGFTVPLESWLRGPLREWAESLLDERRLTNEGYFNAELIRHIWHEHLYGKRNWHHQLWNVLVFQMWLEDNH